MSFKENISLDDKKVILLGAGQIGSKVLDYINEFDTKVLIIDVKNPKNIKEGNQFKHFDCTKLDKIATAFENVISEFGVPDLFINASYPKNSNWANCDFNNQNSLDIIENINFHLGSYTVLSKIICEKMKSVDTKGSVVLLNSIYGIVAQDEELYTDEKINMSMPYPIIKSGVSGLTRQLSSYYGKYGIRINSICSGGIRGNVSGTEEDMDNSFAEKYLKKVPLRRMATTDDVANMVCFLGSDASSYVTGQNIPVDGGYSVI